MNTATFSFPPLRAGAIVSCSLFFGLYIEMACKTLNTVFRKEQLLQLFGKL